MFQTGNTVQATFRGSTNLASDTGLQWRLIQASETEFTDAFSKGLDGDPTDLKTLLSSGNSIYEAAAILDTSGDSTTSFPAPSPGTYILLLVAETSSPYQIIIYGTAIVQVLAYDLTTSNPTSVVTGGFVNANIEIDNPPVSTDGYTYGAIMINQNFYSLVVDITTDGTVQGSNVKVNDEIIAEGSGIIGSATLSFPGFTSLDEIDTSELTSKLNNIFGAGNLAIGFSETTQTSQNCFIVY